MKFTDKNFGEVEITDNTPYLKVEIIINDRKSNCGLYIADDIARNEESTIKVKSILETIASLDTNARHILNQEFNSRNSLIIDFIDFHLEEVLDEIKEKLGVDHVDHTVFMENLNLKAIAFHLDEDGNVYYGIDYSIGEDFTDELLVVKFSSVGDLIEVAHES